MNRRREFDKNIKKKTFRRFEPAAVKMVYQLANWLPDWASSTFDKIEMIFSLYIWNTPHATLRVAEFAKLLKFFRGSWTVVCSSNKFKNNNNKWTKEENLIKRENKK